MGLIGVTELMTLEKYDQARASFRKTVIAHKKNRQISVGPHIVLCFEDRMTIRYQIQEMLRTERIFERQAVQEELDAYNPLIPDGNNWKATMMIQIPDVEARRVALTRLIGIESNCWVQVEDDEPVFAIADEDIERATPEKTSAVHFLRFEFSTAMCDSLKRGKCVSIGFDHAEYQHVISPMPSAITDALRNDLA